MRGFSETEGDFSCHICKRLGFDGERLDFNGGISWRLNVDGVDGAKLDFDGSNSGGVSEKKWLMKLCVVLIVRIQVG